MPFAIFLPFFAVAALDDAFLPFFPAALVFFGLLDDPLFTFFMVPVAARLAAFFGLPLDFFFFFFKVQLLSSRRLARYASP